MAKSIKLLRWQPSQISSKFKQTSFQRNQDKKNVPNSFQEKKNSQQNKRKRIEWNFKK